MQAVTPKHGLASTVFCEPHPLFAHSPQPFQGGLYHSLAVNPATLPQCLDVIAHDSNGEIMALAHKSNPHLSLQFHPESVLTPMGSAILASFLRM